jgi:integrase
MAKVLTAAAVAKLKPQAKRREMPDGGCKGLYLVIQAAPSSVKSWAYRYRRADGTNAKLTLGRVDLSGKEDDGEPKIGDPLSVASARVLAAEVERQRRRGRDPAADHIARKEQARVVAAERAASTFAAAARQFVDEHKVRRSGERPKHWHEVARILGLNYPADAGEPTEIKGGLAERWRGRLVAEIDGHDVYAIIDESRRRGIPGLEARNEDVSDNRGRKVADALGTMFKWLLQHRRINVNPCLGVWRPPAPAPRARALNAKIDVRRADELRWFWSACGSVGEPFATVFKLLLLTGCRRDEIGQARWSELSDDFSVLHLPGARTKNGLPHDVPLAPMARKLIKSVKRIEGSPFLFTISGKTPVGGYAKAKVRLDERMLELARQERGEGAEIEPFVLHDLRRSCSTGMAGIGVAPHIIEACLNHVSGARAGVAGTYNREEYAKEKAAALTKWAEHIERIVTGQEGKVVAMRGRS